MNSRQRLLAALHRTLPDRLPVMEGGYILSPSDHFFDAEQKLIATFTEEAHACRYRKALVRKKPIPGERDP